MKTALAKALQRFESMPISALSGNDLDFFREDFKFIIPCHEIDLVFDFLKSEFLCAQDIGETDEDRLFHYKNIYLDTSDYLFFNKHRQGKYNRIKLRTRSYENGHGLTFAECKKKIKDLRTRKKRIQINDDSSLTVSDFFDGFLKEYGLSVADLTRKTNIDYSRVHLLSRDTQTRITIDTNIRSSFADGNEVAILPHHYILEVKSNTSPRGLIKFLQSQLGIRETAFSKYCVSLCILEPSVRSNKWKQILKYAAN